MTREPQLTEAVSVMRSAPATSSSLAEPAAMTFLIGEDNGGDYHWTIVADGGETLVRSAGFGSYEEAEQAAHIVHRGASQAAFEDRTEHPPPLDLSARRDVRAARDDLDAERWLDEGGSFRSEAAIR
jgi:uncharacterized protein YegP (UPF0339 family)